MVTIWVLTLLVLVLGLVENAVHHRRRRKIPIRIHVNGTRGKSTTTRLIAGILRQAGYKTIAKTTGTAAVLIQADGTESPLARRKSPSIAEQIKIVKEAALRGADALVIECMALNPEMQWVAEKRILQSTIGVITNVRQDHQDEMGESEAEVASVLARGIPKSAHLIVGEAQFYEFFRQEAAKIATSAVLADAQDVSPKRLAEFPYLMFRENIACALEVADLLQIPHSVAWQGMKKAAPDLGATRIYILHRGGTNLFFVNALAANDLTSTLLVWEKWSSQAENSPSIRALPTVGLLHNRADRSYRVKELVQIAQQLPLDSLWLTGDLRPVTGRRLKKGGFVQPIYKVGKRTSAEQLIDDILQRYKNGAVLFAYGNVKGFGQELTDYISGNGELANDTGRDRHRPGF